MISGSGRRTASLFVQVLALVMASLVAAQLITTLVIFNLPRPDPDVYRLDEVAYVLGGGQPAAGPRPLLARTQARPPRDMWIFIFSACSCAKNSRASCRVRAPRPRSSPNPVR